MAGDTLQLLALGIQHIILVLQLGEHIYVGWSMTHITEEVGVAAEHIRWLYGVEDLPQGGHRMIGFTAKA
jgi:hypothetical protein